MTIELNEGEVIELSERATRLLAIEARKRRLSMFDALQQIIMEELGQESFAE